MTATLTDGALKVAVILLAALAADLLLRRQSAALRHWVLAVAVACASVLPLVAPALPAWGAPWWSSAAAVDVPGESQASIRPVPSADLDRRGAAPVSAADERVPIRARAALPLREIVWTVWLAGAVAGLLPLVVGLIRLRRLASRATVLESGPWWRLGEELRRASGVSSGVRLLASGRTALPITWGWRRPRILLPAAAAGWPRARLQVVLTHELAHVARGDWAVQLVAEGVRALHWFNPLAWIVCRRLRVASERACDDAVLAGGVEGAQYAAHLLALARDARGREPWLAAPAMARSSSLEGRVRAMLNTTLNRRPVSRPARTGIGMALVVLTLAVGGLRAQSAVFTLKGTVLDPTGRVLPGTRLVLMNATSHASYEVKSGATGGFEFAGLPPGPYRLEASLIGFATVKLNLEIASDTERTLRLALGSVQETVNVNGNAVAAPPDPSAAQKREDAIRRGAAFVEREQARCAGAAPTKVGGNILAPRKLVDVRPVYPASVKAAGVTGTVTMDAVIGTDGLVRAVRNVKGPNPDLEAAAAAAVRQWRFSTTLLNCEPVEVEMRVTVNFELGR